MKRWDCTLRSPQVLSIYPGISVEYTWSLPFSFCGHDCGILSVVTNVWHAWTSMLSLFFFLRYLTQVFQTELVVTFTHNLLIDPRSVLFSWRSKLMNLKRVNILGNWWQPVWKPDFFFLVVIKITNICIATNLCMNGFVNFSTTTFTHT